MSLFSQRENAPPEGQTDNPAALRLPAGAGPPAGAATGVHQGLFQARSLPAGRPGLGGEASHAEDEYTVDDLLRDAEELEPEEKGDSGAEKAVIGQQARDDSYIHSLLDEVLNDSDTIEERRVKEVQAPPAAGPRSGTDHISKSREDGLEHILDDENEEAEPAEEIGPPPRTATVDESTVMPFKSDYVIDDLLTLIYKLDASDLHLSAGAPPVIRLHGDLIPLGVPVLSNESAENHILSILNHSQKERFFSTKRLDFTYEMGETARFRTNVFFQYHGIAAAFRLIPHRIPSIAELKLPPILHTISMSNSGICLVTGPTGSGKSTTLAAMIDFINDHRKAHIITIEDPVEFFHTNKSCLIDHREIGTHANSFADAVRAALREDPDIILVGEMRDLETIYQAIKVAETGCLVFATLHTNNASKTVDRMIDVFPAKQQAQIRSMLAQSLRAVISQQLIKRADRKGRCVAQEILLSVSGLSNLIREGKTNQVPNFINMGRSLGMQSMDMALMKLVEQGLITMEAAREKARDQQDFEDEQERAAALAKEES